MKELIKFIKSNSIEFVTLFVMVILLNIIGISFWTSIIACITYHMPVQWNELSIQLILLLISLTGLAVISLRIRKRCSKTKLLLNLFVIGILGILLFLGFNFAMKFLSIAIYNSITGSFATAKIIFDSTATVLRVPLDALLLCLVGNAINNGKLIYKVSCKKYLTILSVCLLVWFIRFLFLMIPNSIFSFTMQSVVLAFAVTLVLAIVLHQKEEIKYEIA